MESPSVQPPCFLTDRTMESPSVRSLLLLLLWPLLLLLLLLWAVLLLLLLLGCPSSTTMSGQVLRFMMRSSMHAEWAVCLCW